MLIKVEVATGGGREANDEDIELKLQFPDDRRKENQLRVATGKEIELQLLFIKNGQRGIHWLCNQEQQQSGEEWRSN